DPAPSDRVLLASKIVQHHLCSFAQLQISDRRSHRVQRRLAHRRREPTEQHLRAWAFHGARPEAVSEKVKGDILVFALSPIVLTINDLGLRWMQLQAAFRHPRRQRFPYDLRLPL